MDHLSIHIYPQKSVMLGHPNSSASLFSSAATAPGVMSSVRCSSTLDDFFGTFLAIDNWEFAKEWGFNQLTSKKMQKG